MSSLIIHTDGGSRNNPGPAATGIVILDANGEVVHEFGRYLGTATNNVAEYTAVLDALNYIVSSPSFSSHSSFPSLHFKLDSQLVVEQLNGHWKINDSTLKDLNSKILNLISQYQLQVNFVYIPRAQNAAADKMVNQTLDGNL